MSYRITYKDDNGKIQTKINNNNEADARGWTSYLARQFGQATCVLQENGKTVHLITEGDA